MSGGQARRPGAGGRTKSGKPRPGTGGYGKRRLEGKGPTPPAHLRPGHPAQRRAGTASSPATARNETGAPAPSRGEADRYGNKSKRSGRVTEVVAGRNAVLESLRAGVPATALHIGPRLDSDERLGEAVTLAADARIPVVEAGRAELDRLAGGAVHQGIALRVRPYEYAHPGDLVERAAEAVQPALIVALDGVTDPRNLGAVARSVAAFGGHGVLVPARRSAGVTAGAWKASAGALARVPVAQASNLAATLTSYQEAGLFAVGLAADGDAAVRGQANREQARLLIGGQRRGQVAGLGDRHPGQRARGRLPGPGGHSRGPARRDQHAVPAERRHRAGHRAQVPRVGNPVQRHDQGRLGRVGGPFDQVIGVRVLVGTDPQHHSLVHRSPGEPVQFGAAGLDHGYPGVGGQHHRLADPLVGVQPRPDVQGRRGHARAQRFEHRVSPGDHLGPAARPA